MVDDPYRRVAGLYDRLFEPINRGLRLLGLRMFIPRRGSSVLDVGCGTGTHLALYQRFECQLHGIDSSPAMLAHARSRLGDAADLRLGDAQHIPFDDDSLDLVIAMLALHEMEHEMRMAVLGEMSRVMAPDGRMLLIDFHPGRAEPFQGWLTKLIIWLSEIAAGRRHFRNYRQFMRIGGIPALLADTPLVIDRQKIVSGALSLHLIRQP